MSVSEAMSRAADRTAETYEFGRLRYYGAMVTVALAWLAFAALIVYALSWGDREARESAVAAGIGVVLLPLFAWWMTRRIVDHGADSFGLVSSRTPDRTPRWLEAVMIIGASVIVIALAVVRLLR
ncbi:hypothetical protein [Iamia sp.]|uniref:hypothetical protein n=1 Tax=Iamia sp. TaxID=2722710 RepID=UPI002B929729|nr:hypothetical protein [Iamia sp.]HXH58464.1 hypothetical protein [Iamia sp.]